MAKPGRFSPGVIDYDDMSARYESGRALSGKAANTWLATVAPFVQRSARPRILDLGAGTGRFSVLFARSFEATVIGIEPSMGMLAAAAHKKPQPDGLTYVAGAAERLPLADSTCDLVWLSHVWHHVRDRQACAAELRRVVRTGGHVLVRSTFGDQLDGFPTVFRFWPAARGICEQLPTIQETVRVFETNRFTLVDHQRVPQETASNLSEFARRTQARADSALVLISDAEFHQGQAAIEAAAGREQDPVPVIEVIELLIFRKR
jgi:ubiquinone/menaquinone biosynthesis C-methylase UbiE